MLPGRSCPLLTTCSCPGLQLNDPHVLTSISRVLVADPAFRELMMVRSRLTGAGNCVWPQLVLHSVRELMMVRTQYDKACPLSPAPSHPCPARGPIPAAHRATAAAGGAGGRQHVW